MRGKKGDSGGRFIAVDNDDFPGLLAELAAIGVEGWRVEGRLLLGPYGLVPTPSIEQIVSVPFARGYEQGVRSCKRLSLVSEQLLPAEELALRSEPLVPARLCKSEQRQWRAGFLFGWVIAWYRWSSRPHQLVPRYPAHSKRT